jgi:hypothetical protein
VKVKQKKAKKKTTPLNECLSSKKSCLNAVWLLVMKLNQIGTLGVIVSLN